jgi:hypothetical protein
MSHSFSKSFEVLKHWDNLPDDVVVSAKVAALVLGVAERTIRYHPRLTRVPVSAGRYGFTIGNLRLIVRGGEAA